jgi:serine/threonine protein kinase
LVPSVISHFEILEKLGEGGMGVVYKARDTTLDRFVALKFLPPHVASSSGDRARFLQEAKALFEIRAISTYRPFDVTPDGEHILVNSIVGGNAPGPVNLVINWAAEVKNN